MILTAREIRIALQSGQISIEPCPVPEAFSSTSIDLTLAAEGQIWQSSPGLVVRPGRSGFSYSALAGLRQSASFENGYSIHPKSFVLGWTLEKISVPAKSRIAARVEGKSSLARLGIGIHVTAPTIHAGFVGQIQLEIFNFGPHEIMWDHKMRICQLICEATMGTPEVGYSGSFSGQSSTS